MSDSPGLSFPTSLGTSTADQIRLLGQDLTADLMGQVSFGELAFWLVTLRRPTPSETRVFEAVLVALADHGFTPTAIAARVTYLSAPDSLQGALAAEQPGGQRPLQRSEEHTSELQSQSNLVCRLLLEKKNKKMLVEQPAVC